jgi:hypothetical protein
LLTRGRSALVCILARGRGKLGAKAPFKCECVLRWTEVQLPLLKQGAPPKGERRIVARHAQRTLLKHKLSPKSGLRSSRPKSDREGPELRWLARGRTRRNGADFRVAVSRCEGGRPTTRNASSWLPTSKEPAGRPSYLRVNRRYGSDASLFLRHGLNLVVHVWQIKPGPFYDGFGWVLAQCIEKASNR